MKTLDEVIAIMDGIDQTCTCYAYQHDCDEVECVEKTALYYLKTIETTENLYHDAVTELSKWKDEDWKDRQLPLTWDELKQMKGKPVWVEIGDGSKRWVIIRKIADSGIVSGSDGFIGIDTAYGMDNTWRAYRKERE